MKEAKEWILLIVKNFGQDLQDCQDFFIVPYFPEESKETQSA